VIQLRHVTLEYPGAAQAALDDINLYIPKGEFVYLIGHSGAGKSSLMNLLLKRETPSSGEVYLSGESLKKYRGGRVALHRRRIGMVFQDNLLLHNLTVFDNVAFALRVIGLPQREWRSRVLAVLGLVGLEERHNAFPRQLSLGEQQRVALARAVVSDPPLLLLDEPTGNLDPDTSFEIVRLVQSTNLRGTTVVFATHAREVVEQFRHRTLTLRRGKLVRDDPFGGYAL